MQFLPIYRFSVLSRPGIQSSLHILNTFSRSDWLFSANCILPIVNLIVFIKSIPSRGVISVHSVINLSIFLFVVSVLHVHRNFSPEVHSVFVYILCRFTILLSIGIIVTGDPVSNMNYFHTPFIWIAAV